MVSSQLMYNVDRILKKIVNLWAIFKLPQCTALPPKQPCQLLQKNVERVKYQLYGPWNDDKVNNKLW